MVLGQLFSSVPDTAKATAIDKTIETATEVVIKGTDEVGGVSRVLSAIIDDSTTVAGEAQSFLGSELSGYGNTVIIAPVVAYATWATTRDDDRNTGTRALLSATAGVVVAAVYFATWSGGAIWG